MPSSPDKPDAPQRIAARVELLRSDVRRLADCAERLRRIEAELEEGGAAPPWLRESVRAHLDACAVAAADLTEAEVRLSRYAERLGG
ncbi:hypothetical protein ABZ470_22445 [Streptosporangium sp. NPDC020072]|uniref:hypothetical protein n=1 Tax=Streptosporangium sp. NPDC020072 TaxID=3154788 RepID=UPI003440F821